MQTTKRYEQEDIANETSFNHLQQLASEIAGKHTEAYQRALKEFHASKQAADKQRRNLKESKELFVNSMQTFD